MLARLLINMTSAPPPIGNCLTGKTQLLLPAFRHVNKVLEKST
jgi:hypothetical protein